MITARPSGVGGREMCFIEIAEEDLLLAPVSVASAPRCNIWKKCTGTVLVARTPAGQARRIFDGAVQLLKRHSALCNARHREQDQYGGVFTVLTCCIRYTDIYCFVEFVSS